MVDRQFVLCQIASTGSISRLPRTVPGLGKRAQDLSYCPKRRYDLFPTSFPSLTMPGDTELQRMQFHYVSGAVRLEVEEHEARGGCPSPTRTCFPSKAVLSKFSASLSWSNFRRVTPKFAIVWRVTISLLHPQASFWCSTFR